MFSRFGQAWKQITENKIKMVLLMQHHFFIYLIYQPKPESFVQDLKAR